MNDTPHRNHTKRQTRSADVHDVIGDAITVIDPHGRSTTFVDMGTHLEVSLGVQAHIAPSLALQLAAALIRFATDGRH